MTQVQVVPPAPVEDHKESREPKCAPDRASLLRAIETQDKLSSLAYRLRKDGHVSEGEAMLIYAAAESAWDDAIHLAAPWDGRVSLCGNWGRNLESLDAPRPDGISGCWTCLQTAAWLSAALAAVGPGQEAK